LALALLCAASAAGLGEAPAQTYPVRPIHLVVGNPPGGATDVIARTIGTPFGERVGQNLVIEHRPGANGNISAEVVAAAKPDGYTLLYANNSLAVINPHIYTKWKLKPLEDLVPVVTTITNQLVLAANPTVIPPNDFRGFIDFMKGKSLFYASIGNGSQHHLAMEMLKQRAKIDLTHVPYKGGGPAGISVIAGENAVMFGGTSVVQHINSGKLKGLAVSGKRGWATLPNLPGIGEFYPGYEVVLWHGIFAPKGTPQPILDKLRADFNAVLAMPQVKERLVKSGAGEPYVTTPQQFAELLRADYERYGKVIKELGFKVD
jgi:tripartite-type tricarboxylate transporter receptor subunit TctC